MSRSTAMRVHPGAPLPTILRSLRRAGWGPLAGREWGATRQILLALADSLPSKSAEGRTTAWQLAQSASISEKWTRTILQLLEDLGVIRWIRGGIISGQPTASRIRVVKSVLVDFIRLARPAANAAEADRASRLNARITKYRLYRMVSKKPRPAPTPHPHAEVTGTPYLQDREGRSSARPSLERRNNFMKKRHLQSVNPNQTPNRYPHLDELMITEAEPSPIPRGKELDDLLASLSANNPAFAKAVGKS